jgi:hypothetical protein
MAHLAIVCLLFEATNFEYRHPLGCWSFVVAMHDHAAPKRVGAGGFFRGLFDPTIIDKLRDA